MTDPITIDLLSLEGLYRHSEPHPVWVAFDKWLEANGITPRRVTGEVCNVTDATITLVLFDVDEQGNFYRAGDDVSKRGRAFPLLEPLPRVVRDWALTHPYEVPCPGCQRVRMVPA